MSSTDDNNKGDVDSVDEIDVSGDGGVMKKILRAGNGSEYPQTGDKVTVHYTGTLLDGSKFDSSVDRNTPFEFDLGKGSVIKGWDLGVATMSVGEKSVLTCTADYAYGERGSPPKIPAHATLQFEVELLDFDTDDFTVLGETGTNDDVLARAEDRKAKGNALVKAGDYLRAVNQYTRAIEVMKVYCHDLDAETQARAEDIECKCHANSAMCHLKLEQFEKAVQSANNTLRLDANNVKGAYRLGMAYTALGNWSGATKAFQLALSLDPDNNAAKKELRKVERLYKKEKAEEESLMADMMSGLLG